MKCYFAAECLPGRTDVQCLHRWQKVLKPDLVKGPWSKEVIIIFCPIFPYMKGSIFVFQNDIILLVRLLQEDSLLIELVGNFSEKKWSEIAEQLPGRMGKQCRER